MGHERVFTAHNFAMSLFSTESIQKVSIQNQKCQKQLFIFFQAHDADGTGQNSELEYTVDSSTDGQWSISSEGVLKLEDPIDRENIASGFV